MSLDAAPIDRPLRLLSLGKYTHRLTPFARGCRICDTECLIDGGGVRGLSTLLILRRLMRTIRREEDNYKLPKPCEYFDLIGGTSTGGSVDITPSLPKTLFLTTS